MRASLAFITLASTAFAGAPVAADKSDYDLFHPTPRAQMREMSTDRPDQTESPYTVDAGHWQVELDFLNVTLERNRTERSETWNFAPINLKLGLTNRVDLQMLFDGYTRERSGGITTRGWGDLTMRLKVNLWGNDGGSTAAAVMPFVKVPLHGQGEYEGGIILPLAVELPGGWGMGVMTEVDWLADADGRGHHAEWLNSITFSHDITERLGGYVEFVAVVSTERGAPWVGQIDCGLTFAVTDNVQLDAGCNFGITRAAPDLQPFLGISLRF